MFTQAEIEYIQKQYARGLTSDAITNKLVEAGWDEDDIKDGIKEVERLKTLAAPVQQLKNNEPLVAQSPTIGENIAGNQDAKLAASNESPAIDNIQIKPAGAMGLAEKESIFPSANKPIKSTIIVKLIIGIILALLILGGLAFAYYQFFYKPNNKIGALPPAASSDMTQSSSTVSSATSETDNTISDLVDAAAPALVDPQPVLLEASNTPSSVNVPLPSVTSTQTQAKSPAATKPVVKNPELVFLNNLASCTPSKLPFVHPFTGDTLQKEILGIVGAKCLYVEQVPGNMKMECKYSESERKAASDYYKDIAAGMSETTNIKLGGDAAGAKVTYTVNGKSVSNPLQEALDNKVCTIN